MRCPACNHPLVTLTAGAVHVEACQGGCGGIWLDRLELRSLDEASEGGAESLLDLPRDASRPLSPRPRRCPRCEARYPLRTRRFHPTVHVDIDECPGCAGHWLEFGELHAIRAKATSDEERHLAALRTFDEMFDKQLAQESVENDSALERLRRWFTGR